jgi:hypothetical protein
MFPAFEPLYARFERNNVQAQMLENGNVCTFLPAQYLPLVTGRTGVEICRMPLYGTPQSGHMMQGHLFIAHARGNSIMSGGSAGPEGSLLGLPAQVIGLFVFLWAVRRAGLFVNGRNGPELLHTTR